MEVFGLKPQQRHAAEKVCLGGDCVGPESNLTYVFAVMLIF